MIVKLKKMLLMLDIHKERKNAVFILMMAVVMTLIETIGISLIMPFIQIALDFEEVHKNKYYEQVFDFFSFYSEKEFVISFGIFLLLFFVFRTLYTVFYNYNVSKYSKQLYRSVAEKLFSGFVGLSYREFIERNSSQLTQMIVTEANSTTALIRAMILAFGDLLTIVVIYVLLLVMSWKITLVLTIFMGLNVWVLTLTVTRKIKKSGVQRAEAARQLFKMLQESFGNFKMMKLRSDEEGISAIFRKIMKELVHISITTETLQQIPRLLLELIGFILIISMIMYWIIENDSNISGFMGILSVFLFAMYRLLPAFNRVLTGYNQIMFLKRSFELIRDNLTYEKEKIGSAPISFHDTIILKDISFGYLKDKPIFEHLDLKINKGDKIAFIGPSGSGKSTIVDLIIGLYKPSVGSITVDDTPLNEENIRAWRRMIGYIPQDIYLLDASVAQNVALQPEEEIDKARVVNALKQAHIYDFLQKHQNGIETTVGDRGVKLSGGQKQRIAIARALYHDPEILVLDEATSALDSETEKEIMKNIYEAGKNKTLIIIAHRLSTIKGCDRVYTMRDGNIVETDS